MIKVYVWTKGNDKVYLNYLKPRRYMCGWTFERAMKYIQEELYWNDIEKEEVEVIGFENEKEHWFQSIPSTRDLV